jgi:RNA polymerase sigma-70 factor (ECF subfamily)
MSPPSALPPDEVLVERSLAGDEDAFGALVSRYQGYVAAVASRTGVPSADLDDAVSGVFLKVWRNLHQFRPGTPFATWLYRVTVNHAFDEHRRARRERAHGELREEVPDGRPGGTERLLGDERAELVRAALAELEPIYRAALFAVYVEGRTIEETAAALGIPEGTVKARLHRGRHLMAAILRRRHPGHFGD